MKLMIAIMIASGLLFACDSPSKPPQAAPLTVAPASNKTTAPPKGAVAKVGDHYFTEADIDAEFLRMPDSVKKMQQQTAMRTNLLKNIMTRYALVTQAKQQGVNDDPLIKARIESMTASILIQALNQKMRKELAPSENDVRQYYKEHRQQYQQAPQWHVRHILLKDEAAAKKVLASLKKGADFASLATKMSQDPATADKGGELLPFRRGQMGAVIEQALQKLNANNPLSGVVHSHLGYHVFQWIDQIPAGIRPFDDVKVQMTTQLQQQGFRNWVAQMKKDVDYEILARKYRLPDVRSPVSIQPRNP